MRRRKYLLLSSEHSEHAERRSSLALRPLLPSQNNGLGDGIGKASARPSGAGCHPAQRRRVSPARAAMPGSNQHQLAQLQLRLVRLHKLDEGSRRAVRSEGEVQLKALCAHGAGGSRPQVVGPVASSRCAERREAVPVQARTSATERKMHRVDMCGPGFTCASEATAPGAPAPCCAATGPRSCAAHGLASPAQAPAAAPHWAALTAQGRYRPVALADSPAGHIGVSSPVTNETRRERGGMSTTRVSGSGSCSRRSPRITFSSPSLCKLPPLAVSSINELRAGCCDAANDCGGE